MKIDLGFYIGDLVTACLFFVELLLSTWTRSVFTYPPLRWQGYFLSVSFFLDVFIIFSLLLPVILSGSDIPFDSTSGVIVRIITLYGRAIVAYKAYLDIVNRFVDAEKIPYQPPTNNRAGGRSGDTLRRGSTASSVPHTDVTAISSNNSVAQRRRSSVGGVEPPDYDRFDSVGYHVRQSKLGSQLTSAITIKVIAIILIMLIILPLTFYEPTDTGPYNYTLWLNNAQANSSIGYDAQNAIYNQYISDMQSQPAFYGFSDVNNTYYLVQLNVTPFVEGFTFDEQSFLNSLRPPVVRRYYISLTNNDTLFYSRAVYNLNPLLRTDALYTIILTVVIIILLVIAISVITSDVQRLVLGPIERMVKMVVAVSKKPLEKQEFDYSQMNEGQFETRLLESTVDKITSLLRVGYGEAGSGIISANLNIDDSNYSSSAVINPLIPGVRVYAIVGFCDIHHFEDVNQRLEKDVLNFVNTIAEIVHSSVQHWGGQCNKNLGNAFVVIWRIGDEGTLLAQTTGISRLGEGASGNLRASPALRRGSGMGNDDDGGTRRRRAGPVTLDIRRVPGVGQLSDRALIAFLKVIAEINRNQRVLIYRSEPRLTSNDTQQFRVRMGFGLHIGWAIEGAVGSLHKVDATYLSPHVNMAARLETSSRQYGVPLLLSQV